LRVGADNEVAKPLVTHAALKEVFPMPAVTIQRRPLFVSTVVLLASLLVGGAVQAGDRNKDRVSGVPAHSTLMGFTPWPPDLTENAVVRVYKFIDDHANLIAHHLDNGVPWDEALANTRFPGPVREDWSTRRELTPRRMPVFLALTPLNEGRDGLALAWNDQGDNQPLPRKWAKKRLNSRDVKQAYLTYVRRAVAYFRPRYVAIGIESNILISKAPRLWDDYLELNAYVYSALKRDNPDLPIFATVQYEHLRGIDDDAKPNLRYQQPGVRRLMRHSDLMALSTYRFGVIHPNPMTPDYFDLAESFGRPVAVAESGDISKTVQVLGLKLKANEADQRAFVAGLLAHATAHHYPFVINWVAIDFDPLLKRLEGPVREVATLFAYAGLQRANGRDKPALAVWDAYLQASSRQPCPGVLPAAQPPRHGQAPDSRTWTNPDGSRSNPDHHPQRH